MITNNISIRQETNCMMLFTQLLIKDKNLLRAAKKQTLLLVKYKTKKYNITLKCKRARRWRFSIHYIWQHIIFQAQQSPQKRHTIPAWKRLWRVYWFLWFSSLLHRAYSQYHNRQQGAKTLRVARELTAMYHRMAKKEATEQLLENINKILK